MIIGTITPDREAVIPLVVFGSSGQQQALQAVIDTGFNGYLTLPPALIATLGLVYHSQIVVTLGDGSQATLREFEATVEWDGQARDVLVLEADGGPLIGMAMLYGNEVLLKVIDGGDVIIRDLP